MSLVLVKQRSNLIVHRTLMDTNFARSDSFFDEAKDREIKEV
jgi:hypothetical protein